MNVAIIPASDRPVTKSDNAPPDPFEAHRTHIDDLYLEAGNWCDEDEIETEAQAAVVDRLIDEFKEAIAGAEAARDEVIKPLSEQVTAERVRWYPLIGDTTKVTGKAVRAKKALLAVKTRWGDKVRAQQRAEAERLRQEAAQLAQEAATAAREAVGDLQATEQAENLIRDAQRTLRAAQQAEKLPKGYRPVWRVAVADPVIAVRTAWTRHRDEMLAFAVQLAERDVREGKRVLEGFTITEDKVAV